MDWENGNDWRAMRAMSLLCKGEVGDEVWGRFGGDLGWFLIDLGSLWGAFRASETVGQHSHEKIQLFKVDGNQPWAVKGGPVEIVRSDPQIRSPDPQRRSSIYQNTARIYNMRSIAIIVVLAIVVIVTTIQIQLKFLMLSQEIITFIKTLHAYNMLWFPNTISQNRPPN